MIRKAGVDDAAALAALHRTSIVTLCREHYTLEEVTEWTASLRAELYPLLMKRAEIFVYEQSGQLHGLGVCDPSNALVNAVYVLPERTSCGIGRALMATMEATLVARGAQSATLHATLNAVGFYERLGYARMGAGTNRLASGVELACIVMTKPLSK